jgi:hypothetical protein
MPPGFSPGSSFGIHHGPSNACMVGSSRQLQRWRASRASRAAGGAGPARGRGPRRRRRRAIARAGVASWGADHPARPGRSSRGDSPLPRPARRRSRGRPGGRVGAVREVPRSPHLQRVRAWGRCRVPRAGRAGVLRPQGRFGGERPRSRVRPPPAIKPATPISAPSLRVRRGCSLPARSDLLISRKCRPSCPPGPRLR